MGCVINHPTNIQLGKRLPPVCVNGNSLHKSGNCFPRWQRFTQVVCFFCVDRKTKTIESEIPVLEGREAQNLVENDTRRIRQGLHKHPRAETAASLDGTLPTPRPHRDFSGMRRIRSRKREQATIERFVRQQGISQPAWTPKNGQPWSISDQLNWIETNDPHYTYRVQRRTRQPDAR